MRTLVRIFDLGALLCFTVMMACVLLEVVTRNVIMMPTTWVEELSRFLFIWTIFLGSASAWYRGSHIVINIIPRRLSGRPKFFLQLVTELASLILFLCIWAGAVYLMGYNPEATSTALEIPVSYFYLALFVGVTGILIFHLRQLIGTISSLSSGSSES